MKRLWYMSVPLLVLLAASMLACVAGYFLVLALGDQVPLRKVISKTTQVFLVFSIFPAMYYLGINKTQLGFAARPLFFRQIVQGFGVGFLTLAPVFITLYSLQVMVLDVSLVWTLALVAKKACLALLLGLLIASIEESLFRGIVFVGLRKKMSVFPAMMISTAYYASLHFLETKTLIPASELKLFSGFQLLGEALANMFNPSIVSSWCALFMVGMVLSVIRITKKASLGVCIGCHACWVWQIKMSKSLFNTDFGAEYAFLVSRYDGVIGPLVTVWLMLIVLVVYVLYTRRVRYYSL